MRSEEQNRTTLRWITRRPGLIAAFALILASGCASIKAAPAKHEAEQRWNSVRAKAKLQLARQHAERGLFEEALNASKESRTLDPSQPDAYAVSAKALLELGRLNSAEHSIQAACQQGIHSPELSYLDGVILEQRGEIEAALVKYQKARAGDPIAVDYLTAEAECLVMLGRHEDAFSLLSANRHSVNEDATVAILAARTAALLGRNDEAIQWYRAAQAHAPDSPLIAQYLGLQLARAGRCMEAIPLLRATTTPAGSPSWPGQMPAPSAFAADSENQPIGAVYRALGGCYLAIDDSTTAAAILGPYLANNQHDGLGQLLFAQASFATGDLYAASRAIDLAQKYGAPAPDVFFIQSLIEWRRGRSTAAADSLRRVLAFDPNHIEANCLLGTVLSELSLNAEAAEAFERALSLSPSNKWAFTGLARLSEN